MRYGPPFAFARRRDGRRLAYQVVGAGDLDLVFLFGWPTHLGLMWEDPSFAGFLGKLSSFSRLILFDRLGDGLSDRGPTGHTFDDEMDDVRCVLAAAGSERAAFFGCHTGGRLALLLAATHPGEVSAVVTFGSHPATLRDQGYPWGSTPEERDEVFAAIRGLPPYEVFDRLLAGMAPREAADPSVRRWWRMFCASASSPMETIEGIRSLGPVDIRGLLGTIQVPVLVLHRTGDRLANVAASRYMAERIPGARLVELAGNDHLPFFGDQDAVVALAQEFLTGAAPVPEPDRVLATVLPKALARHQNHGIPRGDQAGGNGDARAPLTDIVDSTGLAAGMGDRRWHRVLVDHQELVRRQLARFGGREVKTTGDGFLATFDGPARAIRAAHAIRAGARDHDLEVRVGLHTGECELLGDDIGGIAVHIAARVLAKAAAGEILCSRTVKDLVAGSGFVFAERGTHRLKGVPDSWQLYAVEPAER
jgi:class 3 adenylate cyclase